MKKYFTFFLVSLVWLQTAAQYCSPLDTSFGIGGRTTSTGFPNYQYSNSLSLIVQPDKKIIQVANMYSGGFSNAFIQRFNVDGRPDQTFGNAGVILFPFYPNYGSISDAALQPDGKILLIGNRTNNSGFFLLRFNGNGSPDAVLGSMTNPIGSEGIEARSLKVQSDGKILVIGIVYETANLCELDPYYYPKVALVRFNSNGVIDSSFGKNGKIITGTGKYSDFARTIDVQPDGRILVMSIAGYDCSCITGYYGGLEWYCSKNYFLIQRLNTDGSPDNTFGKESKVADTSELTFPSGLMVQPDGKILITGSSSVNVITKRYNIDGSPDLNFGSGGKTIFTPDFPVVYISGNYFTIQPDGKIIHAIDYINNHSNGNLVATIVRFNENGSIDSSFAEKGKSSMIFGSTNVHVFSTSVAMQGESIIVGGQTTGGTDIFAIRLRKKIQDFIPSVTADGPTSFCMGDSVKLSSDLSGNLQWYHDGVAINGAKNVTYTATNSGSYKLLLNNSDGCGISAPKQITTFDLPNANVNWNGTTLETDTGFSRYQWFRNGETIPGATGQSYSPGSNLGLFKVLITDAHGCSSFTNEFNMVVTDVADINIGDSKLRYYPNPASSVLYIDLSQQSVKKHVVEIYDLSGRRIRSQTLYQGHNEIPLTGIISGTYGLVISSGNEKTVRKLMVAK